MSFAVCNARMDALAELTGLSVGEGAVLHAALRWVNSDGDLWPAADTWARHAHMSVRALRRIQRKLRERGLLVVVNASRGGPRQTTRFRIPALASNGDNRSGLEPRQGSRQTVTTGPRNPDNGAPKPGPPVRGTRQEQAREQQQQHDPAVADAVSSLRGLGIGDDLLTNPNATPERLVWVAKAAASKAHPAGWAAAAIRDGYAVREQPTTRAPGFDVSVLSVEDRAMLVAHMRGVLPNLAGKPDAEMDGAIRRALDPKFDAADYRANGPPVWLIEARGRLGVAVGESIGNGCHPATYRVHSPHGSIDEGDSGGGEGERSNALRDRQGRGRGP